MKVLHENYKFMKQFQDNVETDMIMPPETAEVLFNKPLTKTYDSLKKLLKDN
jgi:hypothetical protein